MTYTQPVEDHERELAAMPADDTRWWEDIDWAMVAFWLTYLLLYALASYQVGVGL